MVCPWETSYVQDEQLYEEAKTFSELIESGEVETAADTELQSCETRKVVHRVMMKNSLQWNKNQGGVMPPQTGIAMDNVQKFMAAFRGFDGAHGQTIITGGHVNGKSEAKTRIIREPITAEKSKNTSMVEKVLVVFLSMLTISALSVVLILTPILDHADLVGKCRQLDIPGVVCRSKSGGAHIYFFIDGEIPAADMRDKLSEIAAVLGRNAEIFPKQEKLLVERGDVGNAINLPIMMSNALSVPRSQTREKALTAVSAMVRKSRVKHLASLCLSKFRAAVKYLSKLRRA